MIGDRLRPTGEGEIARSAGVLGRLRQLVGWLGGAQAALLVGLFLLALGLRLRDLGARSFVYDELVTLGYVALDIQGLRHVLTIDGNMTLYYWLMFAWQRLVGFDASEAVIRLPSAVASAAAVPAVFLLGKRLHSTAAGLGAAGLLTVNGYHILMSQEARSYALFATLTVCSYLLLDRALLQGRRWDWLLHGLVNALAFYTHFFAAFVMLAQGVFVLSRRSRAALVGVLVSWLATAVLAVQFVPLFLRPRGANYLSVLPPPTIADLFALLASFAGGADRPLLVYLAVAAFGLSRGGVGPRSAGYRSWLLLTWLLVPIGLVFGISQVHMILNTRYLFEVLPALPLLAGVGLARLPRLVGIAAFALAATLSLLVLRDGLRARPTESWRQAAAYVGPRTQPGDGWIFISKWGQYGFEYYAGWRWGRNPTAPYGDVLEPIDWGEVRGFASYRGLLSPERLEPFAASHRRIWLVKSHAFDPLTRTDAAAPVRSWLSAQGYRVSPQAFPGVDVLLYEGPAEP